MGTLHSWRKQNGHTALMTETKNIVKKCKKEFRSQIKKGLKMEINSLTKLVQNTFCEFVHLLSKTFVATSSLADKHLSEFVAYILVGEVAEVDILKYAQISLMEFINLYKINYPDKPNLYQLDQLTDTTATADSNKEALRESLFYSGSQQTSRILQPADILTNQSIIGTSSALRNTLQQIWRLCWERCLEQKEANKITLELTKIGEIHFQQEKASRTDQLLTQEHSQSPELSGQLIDWATTTNTSTLQTKISALEKQLMHMQNKGKCQRGWTKPGASKEKQTRGRSSSPNKRTGKSSQSCTPTRRKDNNQPPGRGQGDRDKGQGRGRSGRGNGRGRGRSRRKK